MLLCFVANEPISKVDHFGLYIGQIQNVQYAVASTLLPPVERINFHFNWSPPTDGDWASPVNCKPCKKAVVLQSVTIRARWELGSYSFAGAEVDENNNDPDTPWIDGVRQFLSFSDQPHCPLLAVGIVPTPTGPIFALGFLRSWVFTATTRVKCVEGADSGRIYATLRWGGMFERRTEMTVLVPSGYPRID